MLLEAADNKLNKQLDLLEMIEVREYTKAALNILINPRQKKIVKSLSLQKMILQETPQEKQPRNQQATQHSRWLQEVLNELDQSNDRVDMQIVEHIKSQLRLESSEDDNGSKL